MEVSRIALKDARPIPATVKKAHHIAMKDRPEKRWVREAAHVSLPTPIARA